MESEEVNSVSAGLARLWILIAALLTVIGVFVACSAVLLGVSTFASIGIASVVVFAIGSLGIRFFTPWGRSRDEIVATQEQAGVPVVEIRDFSFAYPKNPTLLQIPHLRLEGPRLTAIVGPSGVGKSSLVSLIAAQEQLPYKGSLKVLDQEWKDLATGRDALRQGHRRKIGYIPQKFGLLPNWTVLQTLEQDLQDADIPESESASRIESALREMGILDYQRSIIRGLSGGQQQRVAIARMLARRVSLIIADEPTANLDPKNRRDVVASLTRAGQDALVLIVTHDRWVENQCDDIVVLEGGETPAYFGPQPSVAITTRETGHLEMWRFGADSILEHRWKWQDSPWSTWTGMETPRRDFPIIRLTGGVATGTSNYQILAVDSDGKSWRRSWVNAVWREWVSDDPDNDNEEVFGVRSISMSSGGPSDREWWATLNDGRIVHKSIQDNRASPWTEMDTPEGRRISTLAAGTIGEWGQADLIAIDTAGNTWHRWWNHKWIPWEELGVSDARAVAMTSGRPYHLEMWVVTNDGRIRHRWSWGDDRPWSDWHWMDTPESLQVVSISGSLQGHGSHELVVETADRVHWHRRHDDDRWGPWDRI